MSTFFIASAISGEALAIAFAATTRVLPTPIILPASFADLMLFLGNIVGFSRVPIGCAGVGTSDFANSLFLSPPAKACLALASAS